MIVSDSGWSEERGQYCDRYNVLDEGICITYPYGETYVQSTEFRLIEKDWNNDGDIYSLLVADFKYEYSIEQFTPEDIVSLIVHGEDELFNDAKGVVVSGVIKI